MDNLLGKVCAEHGPSHQAVWPACWSVIETLGAEGQVRISMKEQSKGRMMEHMLNSIFGLTPAEARIALGIARGDTLASVADAHGIAMTTARTQLQSVFIKTKTHRQAELVALLARTLS